MARDIRFDRLWADDFDFGGGQPGATHGPGGPRANMHARGPWRDGAEKNGWSPGTALVDAVHGGDGPAADTGDTAPVLSRHVSGDPDRPGFNLDIAFSGGWTGPLQDAVVSAADYLSAAILAGLPDILHEGRLHDDLSIEATLAPVDGAHGVLGRAGPTVLRADGFTPVAAGMAFDIADAERLHEDGLWDAVVLHEMLHALGAGSLWKLMGLVEGSVEGGALRFVGDLATAVYNAEFAETAAQDPGARAGVPIETDGEPGTAGAHWDEAVFGGEVLTGYLSAESFVSTVTLAALEDMGYDTVLDDPADPTDLFDLVPPDPLAPGLPEDTIA